MVENFHELDDISRQASGKRDTIVVCTARKETLFIIVAEAYKLFREMYPDECIWKSKFSKLQWEKKLMARGKEQLQKVQESGKADVLYMT